MKDTTQILENNKLIAEFLGLNLYRGYWYKSTIATERKICKEQVLKFHSDWNWLMQVIEKIEKLKYEVIIETYEVRIEQYNQLLFQQLTKALYKTKIEVVYNTCVEFIKWYNENKQD